MLGSKFKALKTRYIEWLNKLSKMLRVPFHFFWYPFWNNSYRPKEHNILYKALYKDELATLL